MSIYRCMDIYTSESHPSGGEGGRIIKKNTFPGALNRYALSPRVAVGYLELTVV